METMRTIFVILTIFLSKSIYKYIKEAPTIIVSALKMPLIHLSLQYSFLIFAILIPKTMFAIITHNKPKTIFIIE